MTSFVLYRRVSTEEQGKSGLGLEAQSRDMELYLSKLDNPTIVAEFTEIISGKSDARPELAKAVTTAKAAKATLLVSKLDRLSRRVAVVSALMEDPKLEICVASMPGARKFELHIYSALAEQERTFISERTKAALAAAKARGVKLGGVRPGNSEANERRSTEAKERAEKLRTIVEDAYKNGRSLKRTARALNDAGCPTANGGLWTATQVRRVLIRLNIV